jgi:hypothetical protein
MTIWSFIREQVSQFIYWQWKKMGHASAVLYQWIHERINGNNHRE